ncbi:MAG: transglutaminaseTgpA domain-containing protein [Planctomycetota bacterium]|nr:transglutaminaseTgpA domain-containing protein [Planctomycetota bacterium]
MTSQLRLCMMILVVLNLVFVQITGAASLRWMLPWFALAVLAPVLSPLQKYWSYRLAWNIGLLAIFGLLLKDIREAGLQYMLEDGLILAAFCQVHVLNNLAKQNRPDLLFFNSFLIALVTGFFCQNLAYSIVFGIYAVTLVIAICISSASTVGTLPHRHLTARELWLVLGRGFKMAFIAIFLTGLVFAFWPRDFEREGLVENKIAQTSAASQLGFTDQIRLDNKGITAKTNRVVIRAKLLRGSRTQVSEYWRGATFTNLRKHGWWADTNPQGNVYTSSRRLDEPWKRLSASEFSRAGRLGASVAVELSGAHPQALFAPLAANRMQFECGAWPLLDGVFRITSRNTDKIRYTVDLRLADDQPHVAKAKYLRDLQTLRPSALPPETAALHDAVSREVPPAASPVQVAGIIQRYLVEHRSYFLPGESGAADSLRGFIAGEGGGHCEFFASTMVILLRKFGIPCRMVSGYHAHEWNHAENELTIRSNHAHAWVEMWRPGIGWLTLDPTPTSAGFAEPSATMFSEMGESLRELWAKVTTFDASDRSSVVGWTKTQLFDLGNSILENPVWFLSSLAALFVLRRLMRRQRPSPRQTPAVTNYLRTLRQLDLTLRPGETPRQLLTRASRNDLPEADQRLLTHATANHEQDRYS